MKDISASCYQGYFGKGKKFLFPNRIILELTNRCNLLCAMCPRRYSTMTEGFLDYGVFKNVIDEICAYPKTGLVPFFRGESLLHSKFIPMMKYAKEKGIKPIQLATNGLLLDKNISKAILDLGIDFISFSLDSADRDIYKKVRIGSEYGVVLNNIENFLKEKKARKLKLPKVQVSMVETPQTRIAKQSFISYWIKKVDRVRIYQEHSMGGIFGKIDAKDSLLRSKRRPCMKLISEMAVYWNGDVAICNHDWNRKDFIGNVRKKSLAEIWGNEKYQDIRKQHFKGKIHSDTVCAKCNQWMEYYISRGRLGEIYTRKRFSKCAELQGL